MKFWASTVLHLCTRRSTSCKLDSNPMILAFLQKIFSGDQNIFWERRSQDPPLFPGLVCGIFVSAKL